MITDPVELGSRIDDLLEDLEFATSIRWSMDYGNGDMGVLRNSEHFEMYTTLTEIYAYVRGEADKLGIQYEPLKAGAV